MPPVSNRRVILLASAIVSLVFGGCYKSTVEPPQAAAPSAAQPTATQPTATPTATAENRQLVGAVDAALRNPVPRASGTAPVGTAASSGGRSPAPRSPSRSPRTRVLDAPQSAAGVRGISFDDLIFPLEKDQPFVESLLTDSIRGLFGRRIKIRGYIHPSCPFQTGVTSFILVRDDQSCCFGPGAALYDCIIVNLLPGRTTHFTPKPIAVAGVLTLREFKDLDGKHLAIYHLDGETVE